MSEPRDRVFYAPAVLVVMALAGGLMMPDMAQASSGEVNVTGNIVTNTCNIFLHDKYKEVNMGTVSTKQFIHGTTTAFPKAFTLTLVDCGPAATGMTVGFYGREDASRNDLLAINDNAGAATGMGIALLDENKTQIPINTRTPTYIVEPNADVMVLHFYAQYTADGAAVSAGRANATATFNFWYD